jgi:hypothetical protein
MAIIRISQNWQTIEMFQVIPSAAGVVVDSVCRFPFIWQEWVFDVII